MLPTSLRITKEKTKKNGKYTESNFAQVKAQPIVWSNNSNNCQTIVCKKSNNCLITPRSFTTFLSACGVALVRAAWLVLARSVGMFWRGISAVAVPPFRHRLRQIQLEIHMHTQHCSIPVCCWSVVAHMTIHDCRRALSCWNAQIIIKSKRYPEGLCCMC